MDSFVSLKITSDANSVPFQKNFPLNIKIGDLKGKLELITGALKSTMKIKLFINEEPICDLNQDDKLLDGFVSSQDRDVRLHVIDDNLKAQFDDVSNVPKFELTDEEYEKKSESLRAFKMQNKLGRFSQEHSIKERDLIDKEKMESEKAKSIKIGDRCEVEVKGQPHRRGAVMFVGEVHFKPGIWIGVRYDEPLGKNDGSIDGKRYFECPNKYGSFVRPSDLKVGDFPEETMDLDEI